MPRKENQQRGTGLLLASISMLIVANSLLKGINNAVTASLSGIFAIAGIILVLKSREKG